MFKINDDSSKLTSDEMNQRQRERKKFGARCGHIKRRLSKDEPLTGDLLEFALEIAGEDTDVGQKLRAGQKLSEYEYHVFVEVQLLHLRLAS